eukprot:SAG31_NODE_243_length_19342_cov_12.906459_6_plen_129_part_00
MSDDDELSEEPACTQTTEETTYERLVAERKKAFAEANSADQLAKLRATGKEQFNSRDYPGAIQTYTDALALLGGAPTTDAAKKARKTLLLNRAVGHLKLRVRLCRRSAAATRSGVQEKRWPRTAVVTN